MVLFGLISQLVHHILTGRRPLEYHFCTGTNPETDSNIGMANHSLLAVFFFSLVINIAIPIKIRLYQAKNDPSFHHEHRSLTDLTTNISIVILTGICVVSLAGLNTVKRPAVINHYPYYIYAYVFQLIFPNFNIYILMLIYFYRNQTLRSFIFRSIKESIEDACN